MSIKQKCENCVFMREREVGAFTAKDMVTECRRVPPSELDVSNYGVWPRVRDSDWCGQWSPNDEVREQVAVEFAAKRAERVAALQVLAEGGEEA